MFLVLGLLGADALAAAFTADAAIAGDCVVYLRICMVFCLGTFVGTMYQRFLQSVGNTFCSMLTLVAGDVTNLVLAPLLIFGWLGLPAPVEPLALMLPPLMVRVQPSVRIRRTAPLTVTRLLMGYITAHHIPAIVSVVSPGGVSGGDHRGAGANGLIVPAEAVCILGTIPHPRARMGLCHCRCRQKSRQQADRQQQACHWFLREFRLLQFPDAANRPRPCFRGLAQEQVQGLPTAGRSVPTGAAGRLLRSKKVNTYLRHRFFPVLSSAQDGGPWRCGRGKMAEIKKVILSTLPAWGATE